MDSIPSCAVSFRVCQIMCVNPLDYHDVFYQNQI